MSTFSLSKTGKITHFLSFFATTIVVFGILALYYPHILNNSLPESMLQLLNHNSWLPTTIFICGLILNVIAFAFNVFRSDDNMATNQDKFVSTKDGQFALTRITSAQV